MKSKIVNALSSLATTRVSLEDEYRPLNALSDLLGIHSERKQGNLSRRVAVCPHELYPRQTTTRPPRSSPRDPGPLVAWSLTTRSPLDRA
jgi:hypothetical protein